MQKRVTKQCHSECLARYISKKGVRYQYYFTACEARLRRSKGESEDKANITGTHFRSWQVTSQLQRIIVSDFFFSYIPFLSLLKACPLLPDTHVWTLDWALLGNNHEVILVTELPASCVSWMTWLTLLPVISSYIRSSTGYRIHLQSKQHSCTLIS